MVIRSARTDDALRIATIHVESWRAAYRGIVPDEFLRSISIEKRHAVWRRNLEAGGSQIWIAEDGETALGWVSAGASRDVDAPRSTGEIWAIYIHPAHWRERIGGALYATAEQALETQGFRAVTLWVIRDNQRAIEFYQSRGFVADDCKDRIVERGGKAIHEMRMKKQLTSGSDALSGNSQPGAPA